MITLPNLRILRTSNCAKRHGSNLDHCDVLRIASFDIIKYGRSMTLEEAIIDKVRRLPPAKQEEVLRFADGLQRQGRVRMVPSRDRIREMKWIDENRAAYADRWVVVEGDRLIAADTDALKAFAAAKAAGIEVPFLVHVLPDDPLPFVPCW